MTATGFEATTTQFVNNFCFNSWYHLLINRISVKKKQIVAKLYQMCHIISLLSQICHQYSNCYYPQNEYIMFSKHFLRMEKSHRIYSNQLQATQRSSSFVQQTLVSFLFQFNIYMHFRNFLGLFSCILINNCIFPCFDCYCFISYW